MNKIYLDNAATTRVRDEVMDDLLDNMKKIYANPSSVHTYGREARALLEQARIRVAKHFNTQAKNIIFTSGATESNNLAIRGMLEKTDKKEIISSEIEHSSIKNLLDELKDEGYVVKYIKTLHSGKADVDSLKDLISDDTALITVMYVNNETGVIQDIEKISEIIKNKNIYFHVDAVQAISKLDIDLSVLNVSSMSFSGHKIYAPKGVGFLYIKDDIPIHKLIYGGQQERNKRAGTENLNSILSTVYALDLLMQNREKENRYIKGLMDRLLKRISSMSNIVINGIDRVDNILNIQIKGKNIQVILPLLDMQGIFVSGGSACMSGSLSTSHVLKAMGLSDEEAYSSIRISLGIYNTEEEIDYLADCLEKLNEVR